MAVDLLIPLATGVVGMAVGVGASLALSHKQKRMPAAPPEMDVWQHLQDLTAQRARVTAKIKALHRAYASGSIDEKAFITKDAEYTTQEERLDADIERIIESLSAAFLPEEMKKGDDKLREVSDIAELSQKIGELKREHFGREAEMTSMYLQMTELEEDKAAHSAQLDELRSQYESDKAQMKGFAKSIKELEAQKRELEAKVAAIEPKDIHTANLERENTLLRQGLGSARRRVQRDEKLVGVLSAIIDRHAKEIDEGKRSAELSKLVQPKNPWVIELAKKLGTSEKAFSFVRDDIFEVHPRINATYWLDINDMLRLGAADPHDKAILLCSLLRALGRDAKVALVEMQDKYQRALVLADGRALDPTAGRKFDDFEGLSEEEALDRYRFDGFPAKRILFTFDDRGYAHGAKA